MPLISRLERLSKVLIGQGWKASGEAMQEAAEEITELVKEMQHALDERNEFKDALRKLWKLFQPTKNVPSAETSQVEIEEYTRTLILVAELLEEEVEIPDV